ncbi:MAG: hypothetical protein JST16_10550 [Bdellovibrionales bacterium]|nr:hypothetical protein [Bdellovibrionales bacterium]
MNEHAVHKQYAAQADVMAKAVAEVSTDITSAAAVVMLNMESFVHKLATERLGDNNNVFHQTVLARREQHKGAAAAATAEKEAHKKALAEWRKKGASKDEKPVRDFEAKNKMDRLSGNDEWKKVLDFLLRAELGLNIGEVPAMMRHMPELLGEVIAGHAAELKRKGETGDCFTGWVDVYKYVVTELFTSIENSVDQLEEVAIAFIKRLLTKQQAKTVKRIAYMSDELWDEGMRGVKPVKRAANDRKLSMNGWRGVCRELMTYLREFIHEPDKTNRLLLSWLLRARINKVGEALQGLAGVPKLKAAVLIPQMAFTRRHLRFDKAGWTAMLKWKKVLQPEETLSSLSQYFDFTSAAFGDTVTAGLHDPHSFVSNGIIGHFLFTKWRTKKRFKNGKQEEPRAYLYNKQPALLSSQEPHVAQSVTEVRDAGFVGFANADKLIADLRKIRDDPRHAEHAAAQVLLDWFAKGMVAGADPGHKNVLAFHDGLIVALALCYQNRQGRDPVPAEIQALLSLLAANPLKVFDKEKHKAAVCVRMEAIPRLVQHYARQQACHKRNTRQMKRKSLYARIAHDIVFDSNGERKYWAIACGSNYSGGKTLRGVSLAGPAMVKAVLRELAHCALVILGTPLPCHANDVENAC